MPEDSKSWTLLAFMAGDNDLDQEGVRDLEEMKSVDAGGAFHLVAQFDRAEAGRQTRRYALRHGTSLVSDTVDQLEETNTGDPAVLEAFLRWGRQEFPAQHTLAILWNHGGGADDTPGLPAAGPLRTRRALLRRAEPKRVSLFAHPAPDGPGRMLRRRILDDEESGDFLDNAELRRVMLAATAGKRVDILGMDACLMSMAEVLWQVRDTAVLTVASQENEPGEGWPYGAILTALAASPQMSPAALAKVIVAKYGAAFAGNPQVTLSACEVEKLPAVVSAWQQLTAALTARLGDRAFEAAVTQASVNTLRFSNRDYADMHSLCAQLAGLPDAPVTQACAAVQSAVQAAVLARCGPGCGLSVYFPHMTPAPLYAGLDFATATGWGAFLQKFLTTG